MLKRLKELASDSLTYGLSSFLSQLMSLILVPFYTQELRPEDYGVLAMSAILLGFLSPLAGLGMESALFRFYSLADDPAKKNAYFSMATQLKTAAMLTLGLLLVPCYPFLNSAFFEGGLTTPQFGLFLGTFLADNFSALTIVALRSTRQVKKIALVNVATLSVTLTLSIWLVLFEKMQVTGAMTAGLAGAVFRAVLFWSDSRRIFRWVGLETEMTKQLLGYGLPMVPHKVQAQVIHAFTAFIINHQLGIATAGLYAVATKMAKPLAFIVGMVQQSWVPLKFQIHKNDENPAKTFRQLISLYWVGIIALWGILSLLIPWLYQWLIDPKYWAGIPYVPFIMGVSVAQAVYFMITTGFELSSRQAMFAKASFWGMCMLIALSVLAIDYYTPYSFILFQALASLAMGAYLFPEAKRMLRIDYPFFAILSFALVAGCLVVAVFNSLSLHWTVLGMAGVLAAGMSTLWIIFPKFPQTMLRPN